MPRGRRVDLDKRIADLIGQLKAALVAREQQRLETTVAKHVDALVADLSADGEATERAAPADALRAAGPSSPSRKGNRKPRSAAFREAARKRMVAYWTAKRTGKRGKASRPAVAKKSSKAANAKPSPGRLRQIAAMKAFWRKKKTAKGETATAAAK
jgi:hypothetical protein